MTFKRSKYDVYFQRIGEMAHCRLCTRQVRWAKNGGTNCLRLHLASRHPQEMEQLSHALAKQTRSPDESGISLDYTALFGHEVWETSHSPGGNEIIQPQPKMKISEHDISVIAMICEDRLPVTMLDGSGFRKFLEKLRPGVQLKNVPYYIQNVLPALCDNLEEKVQIDLMFANNVSLVFDTFKSDADRAEHVSLSAYWTNVETMEPRHALLFYETGPEFSEISSPFLHSKLTKYGVLHKIIGYMSESQSISKIDWLENSSTKLPNFEEILDENVQKEQVTIASVILFQDTALPNVVLERPDSLSWRGHHEILRILLQIYAIRNSINSSDKENQSYTELTEEEMKVTNFIYSILEQVQEAHDQIRHRHYQTASVIIPSLRVLLHKLTDVVKNDPSSPEQLIGRNVLNKLETAANFSQENMVLKTATFLDPRFKEEFFFECHKSYMLSNFKDQNNKVIKEEVLISPKDEENTRGISLFDRFIQEKSSRSSSEPKTESLEKEIEDYLREETNSQTDPTDFWMQNPCKFPILKSLTSQYLAIPASASGAKKLYEDGEKMVPTGISDNIRDCFVFCSANIDIYGY
ncbi:hypothetical protein GCK72_019705 [Caenorhabditis remanei]|uniref:Uncharacterized protein n=1 Tax=Caenorhabditis remanei TaxID=31234 RepID=A0A6A5GFF3_CAERE|nr:hypothetical protein GCK72_019705 [Caenorhabditis remanei]KAF1753149.1 hypothetical protein GCK72_019705 [Caenorhabditis remanei]